MRSQVQSVGSHTRPGRRKWHYSSFSVGWSASSRFRRRRRRHRRCRCRGGRHLVWLSLRRRRGWNAGGGKRDSY